MHAKTDHTAFIPELHGLCERKKGSQRVRKLQTGTNLMPFGSNKPRVFFVVDIVLSVARTVQQKFCMLYERRPVAVIPDM